LKWFDLLTGVRYWRSRKPRVCSAASALEKSGAQSSRINNYQ